MADDRLSDGTTIGHWVERTESARREREASSAAAEFDALHRAVERATGRRVPRRDLLDALKTAGSNQSPPADRPVSEPADPEERVVDEVVEPRAERTSALPDGVADLIANSGESPEMQRDAARYVAERQADRDRQRRAASARRELEGRFVEAIRSGDGAAQAEVEREFQRKGGRVTDQDDVFDGDDEAENLKAENERLRHELALAQDPVLAAEERMTAAAADHLPSVAPPMAPIHAMRERIKNAPSSEVYPGSPLWQEWVAAFNAAGGQFVNIDHSNQWTDVK